MATNVITKYMRNGVQRPRVLVIDDTLANMSSGRIMGSTYVTTVAEVQNLIVSKLGEDLVSLNSFPYNSNYDDDQKEMFASIFPSSFEVTPNETDCITFLGEVFSANSSTNSEYDFYKSEFGSYNGCYTPMGVSTMVTRVSGRPWITLYVPVFTQAMLNDGFNVTGHPATYNWCVKIDIYHRAHDYEVKMEKGGYMAVPEYFNGNPIPVLALDPYENGGGSSTTGGGTGTFSETGDIVGIPGLPTLSAVDTGFITLFNPTTAQVKQLASYMWSNSFDMATFKNIVANPIDCILGLTIVPVDPPNAGSKAVTVGNIATDVNMPYLSSQYVEVDCGTLNVQEFWGSYLDYSPYTKMSLYLPYIGIVPLDIDDVMNASIAIKYHVDVLSGACVAYVLCNGTQLYTYIGQCSSNVPITSNDFTNTVNGILGIAGSIGSLVATGGASAPTEIGKIAGNAINALKPNIQKSGAMSGTGGLMGVQTPYLICQRPRQSVPASQNTFTGYPSNITATLSDLSGYTEIDKIHLEGVPCTNEEMDEIMTLLESGVYI